MLTSRRVARLKAKRAAASEVRAERATRAAGYIRVSTDEQAAHGHGLESQERAIRAFSESQGYELAGVITDAGVSGATRPADRAGFAKLIEMCTAEGGPSVLLVWKFDRLARQIVFAVTAVNDLAAAGVALRSVTEPVDTSTPMGRTIFAVLAGMAEQERQSITERTWAGRREKASNGGFAGGAAPIGYERDRDGGLAVSTEARTVKGIFTMRRKGATLQAIADRLNADSVPTKRGGKWRPSQVGYILDNPKYKGAVEYLFKWNGADAHVLTEGTHEAIV